MNELTVWDAALSSGCFKTFSDRLLHLLRVDLIKDAEGGYSAAAEEDKR